MALALTAVLLTSREMWLEDIENEEGGDSGPDVFFSWFCLR